MQELLCFALSPRVREGLCGVLTDACTLAGWVALDHGVYTEAWRLYDRARVAARESGSPFLEAYAYGGQSTVLLDIGDPTAATDLTAHAEAIARNTAPRLLRAWIAGAYGEACAANGQHKRSLSAFDEAERLCSDESDTEVPFLVFNSVHLTRWRGNALVRIGHPRSTDVLFDALVRLDPAFVRAEAAVRADLAEALIRTGEREAAKTHAERCLSLARQIGSTRNGNRARVLVSRLS